MFGASKDVFARCSRRGCLAEGCGAYSRSLVLRSYTPVLVFNGVGLLLLTLVL
jgi:hypothetical protein